jgi:hypothetical protein
MVIADTSNHDISKTDASMYESELHGFLDNPLSINTSVLIPNAFD